MTVSWQPIEPIKFAVGEKIFHFPRKSIDSKEKGVCLWKFDLESTMF